jgi:hypothetical protein
MAQSKNSGALNLPLMIVAFLAMGAFLFWLNVTSEPTAFAIAEEGPEAVEQTPARLVQLAEVQGNPEGLVGERLRLRNVEVVLLVGSGAFMIEEEAGSGSPFLVRIDPTAISEQPTILPSDRVTIAGRIKAMSDSVITSWEEQGVFTAEGQRSLAAFAMHFLQADEIEVHTAEQPQADTPGSGDTDDGGAG